MGTRPGRGHRALAAAAGAAVVLLLLTACASATGRAGTGSPTGGAGRPVAPSPAAAHTVVRTFSAYSADGSLTVPVAGHQRGTCFTASIAAPGSSAYRCFAGNRILDPCFAAPGTSHPHTLACVATPWAPATLLRLHGSLPHAKPVGPVRPWAAELAGGLRCVASTGTVPSVAGISLGYTCTGGGAAAVSSMGPAAVAALASYVPKGASTLQQRTVTVLWRG